VLTIYKSTYLPARFIFTLIKQHLKNEYGIKEEEIDNIIPIIKDDELRGYSIQLTDSEEINGTTTG
jgi:hypothetical protein